MFTRRNLVDRMILQDLALTQCADQMRQLDVDGRVIAFLCHKFKRAGKDIVSAQYGNLIAPLRICCLSAAPRIRLIDHIVMHKGRRVNQLECHGHGHRARPIK